MSTAIAELGRVQKPGLQRSAHPPVGDGYGTPAPGEGYALTIADRECHKLTFEHAQDSHDVTDFFALRLASPITRAMTKPFSGLAHSYAAQRRFVDAVPGEQLISGANDAKSSH